MQVKYLLRSFIINVSSATEKEKVHFSIPSHLNDFVIQLGFEPKTHSLEGCCSIQLSY